MLLDAGCSLNGCLRHNSALCCAINFPFKGVEEDILKVLIEKGADVNVVDRKRKSLLCRAHRLGAEVHHIKAMLAVGVSLNACKRHFEEPLFCYMGDVSRGRTFKADMLKVLIDAGAPCRPLMLHSVLQYSRYETEAIKLMLDVPGTDVNSLDNMYNRAPLEYAISNPRCKMGTLKLLIDRGGKLDHVSNSGETLLHVAVNLFCRINIVLMLLQRGSLVNARNRFDCTPLIMAVQKQRNITLLKTLLNAGALVNVRMGNRGTTALEIAVTQYHEKHRSPDSVKLIVKYYLLQNPECIENFLLEYQQHEMISRFGQECARELEEMETKSVGCGLTLREWLPQVAVEDNKQEVKNYDFSQLLTAIAEYEFLIYFDAIAEKLKTSIMTTKLQEIPIYFIKYSNSLREEVFFPYDCVLFLATYLEKEDLLKLILAFCSPGDNRHAAGVKSYGSLKRNVELPYPCKKRTRPAGE